MPVIEVKFGDGAWPELDGKQESGELVWLGAGAPAIRISAIEGGMVGGDPSIAIRFDLPDGRVVVAETSVRAFQMAAAALRGKFGAV